jgi:hypothetical protein
VARVWHATLRDKPASWPALGLFVPKPTSDADCQGAVVLARMWHAPRPVGLLFPKAAPKAYGQPCGRDDLGSLVHCRPVMSTLGAIDSYSFSSPRWMPSRSSRRPVPDRSTVQLVWSEEIAPERHHRRWDPVCADEPLAEFAGDVVGQVGAVDDDVALVDRQHRVAVAALPGGQVTVPADRDHRGCVAQVLAGCDQGLAGDGWPLAPGGMPQGVVLHVEEHSVGGPAKLLAKVAGVAVAPVRPLAAPPWRRSIQRESCREESAVIISELELVFLLNAPEFGIRQARPDFALAYPGQPAGGFPAQPCRFTADHPRTVAAQATRTSGPSQRHPSCTMAWHTSTSFVLALAHSLVIPCLQNPSRVSHTVPEVGLTRSLGPLTCADIRARWCQSRVSPALMAVPQSTVKRWLTLSPRKVGL